MSTVQSHSRSPQSWWNVAIVVVVVVMMIGSMLLVQSNIVQNSYFIRHRFREKRTASNDDDDDGKTSSTVINQNMSSPTNSLINVVNIPCPNCSSSSLSPQNCNTTVKCIGNIFGQNYPLSLTNTLLVLSNVISAAVAITALVTYRWSHSNSGDRDPNDGRNSGLLDFINNLGDKETLWFVIVILAVACTLIAAGVIAFFAICHLRKTRQSIIQQTPPVIHDFLHHNGGSPASANSTNANINTNTTSPTASNDANFKFNNHYRNSLGAQYNSSTAFTANSSPRKQHQRMQSNDYFRIQSPQRRNLRK